MLNESALLRRINRRLAKAHEVVRRSRPIRDGAAVLHYSAELGRVYLLDTFHNRVLRTHVDIAQLGRELGVLAPGQAVASRKRVA